MKFGVPALAGARDTEVLLQARECQIAEMGVVVGAINAEAAAPAIVLKVTEPIGLVWTIIVGSDRDWHRDGGLAGGEARGVAGGQLRGELVNHIAKAAGGDIALVIDLLVVDAQHVRRDVPSSHIFEIIDQHARVSGRVHVAIRHPVGIGVGGKHPSWEAAIAVELLAREDHEIGIDREGLLDA